MNHLYQKLNSKMHTLAYVIIPLLLVLATTVVLAPQKAYAWTGADPNICSGSALSSFNYVDEIKQAYPDYDVQTMSRAVLIYDVDDGSGNTSTAFRIADEINFTQDSSGNKSVTYSSPTQNTSAWPYYDNPIGTGDDGYYPDNFYFTTNSGDTNRYRNLNRWNTTGQNNTSYFPKTTFTNTTFCIVAGINVHYSANWSGQRYPALAPDNGLIQATCNVSWWQIWEKTNCKANEMFKSIGTAISEVAKDIGTGISTAFAWMFIPDMDALNIQFTEMQELWSEKLGFITFPIEFFGSIFTEMQSEVNYTGCTEESCIKNFGNFFGSNLSINFSQMHQVSPTLWQFVLLMLRITAIWSLMITIKWQYWRIMNKGSM